MWWAVAGVLALGAALSGPVMSNVEQPQYRVVEQQGDIEIRDYPPMIVAETASEGARDVAINAGFRAIADYIFGNNSTASTVAMTAPVTQQAGEKIAMTAPVTQQGEGTRWQVRFIMPARYSLATLPTPNNPAVHLRALPARRYAAIRFSGSAREQNLREHAALLQDFLAVRHLASAGAPTYAFYNPPWTLPFLRRNEVLQELAPAEH